MIGDIYSQFVKFPAISTDTRNIAPNSIFFCLKGEQFDGNQFVDQALENGAEFVVTENSSYTDHPKCFVVKNALETLQILATHHRLEFKIPIIGITGTNGKTTTKELITKVLSESFNVTSTKGNLNNHIGVPLTLLSITTETQIAVVEMGANHVGEISELCNMVYPTHGVLTNIGAAHLEGFKSFENILETKMGLYNAVIQENGTLFVNGKDLLLVKEALTRVENCKKKNPNKDTQIHYYGVDQIPFVNGTITEMNPNLKLTLFNQEVQTHLTGFYNLENILCAAAIGRYFNVPEDNVLKAIKGYIPSNQRSQVEKKGTNTIIADYYNANPTSMKAALDNFAQINHPQKIAIIGDMYELGDFSVIEHEKIIELCKEYQIDTYFIGTHFFELQNDNTHFYQSTQDFISAFRNLHFEEAMILVKGSRGVHLEEIMSLLSYK